MSESFMEDKGSQDFKANLEGAGVEKAPIDREEKCKTEVEAKIGELNQGLFDGEDVLNATDASHRVEGMGNLISNKEISDDKIIKEAVAGEIEAAIHGLESKKQGIDPEGGMNEVIRVRELQEKGVKVEPLINLEKVDDYLKKLKEKLMEIRNEIGGW